MSVRVLSFRQCDQPSSLRLQLFVDIFCGISSEFVRTVTPCHAARMDPRRVELSTHLSLLPPSAVPIPAFLRSK